MPEPPKESQRIEFPITPNARGEYVWLAMAEHGNPQVKSNSCKGYGIDKLTWNPATGALSRTQLPLNGILSAQTATPAGIVFIYTTECLPGGKFTHGAAFLQASGQITTASAKFDFYQPRMLSLSKDAVAIIDREQAVRQPVVHVVRLQGAGISIERMPNLGIAMRNDFAAAPLSDNRLMLLGGSDAQYRGCSPCSAKTFILDTMARKWSDGPVMLEARSEHAATPLPDGSILVTGGWTKEFGWGTGPARSAERWNPATNKFEPVLPMPSGTSRHRGMLFDGAILMVAGGTNASIQAYDIKRGTWRTAGAAWQGSEEGGCAFIPFHYQGNSYAWTSFKSEGHYSSQSCSWDIPLRLSALSLTGTSPTSESLLITYRANTTFVRQSNDKPALIIGGNVHAGMNSYLLSAAVEAIDRERRAISLPPLLDARNHAFGFRMKGGTLVIGGLGDMTNGRTSEQAMRPAEWLADAPSTTGSRWIRLPDSVISYASTVGQINDENLIEIGGDGMVKLLTIDNDKSGNPVLTRTDMPHLLRTRQKSTRESEPQPVQARGLPDGRIIVAGGDVQAERIALLKSDSNRSDAADEYISVGEFLPSRRHEIFDPATGRWRNSAPSKAAGGRVAILDDGRVIKIGTMQRKNSEAQYLIEISSADGTQWTSMEVPPASRIRLTGSAKPFAIEGELFLASEYDGVNTSSGPTGVAWFNPAGNRWETLWTANSNDNWRDHLGRIIVRKLANGKRVIIPTGGIE